jgi:DNA polymerase IV
MVSSVEEMVEVAELLLASVYPFRRSVRLLGVTLSTLNTEQDSSDLAQLDLGL